MFYSSCTGFKRSTLDINQRRLIQKTLLEPALHTSAWPVFLPLFDLARLARSRWQAQHKRRTVSVLTRQAWNIELSLADPWVKWDYCCNLSAALIYQKGAGGPSNARPHWKEELQTSLRSNDESWEVLKHEMSLSRFSLKLEDSLEEAEWQKITIDWAEKGASGPHWYQGTFPNKNGVRYASSNWPVLRGKACTCIAWFCYEHWRLNDTV